MISVPVILIAATVVVLYRMAVLLNALRSGIVHYFFDPVSRSDRPSLYWSIWGFQAVVLCLVLAAVIWMAALWKGTLR